ncbi:MAG: hypothetical protein QOH57_2325 [Mycobacterium sp.]|jgi:hypothetical protein|nr:hypothetical protein [Mycobacterium sp.]
MTMVEMGGLMIEAAQPAAVADFWRRALGGVATGLTDGSVRVVGPHPTLVFSPQVRPKSVKNRVHFDTYVRSVDPLLAMGARVLDEYLPTRVTLTDVDDNEFCAFLDPHAPVDPPARAFAVCTDSDRPEELASWWAGHVGARIGDGSDGTPRWLYGVAGWRELIWKFVRVGDERVVPNRWRWTVRADIAELVATGAGAAEPGVLRDPQRNEFIVSERPAGSEGAR